MVTILLLYLLSLRAVLPLKNPNPCFEVHSSDACIFFISEQRHVTVDEARELRRRALALYANKVLPASPVYDRNTRAVACLASDGLLLPGPDSDCAACGNSCTQEVITEICAFYCTNSLSQSQATQLPFWTSAKLRKERANGSERLVTMQRPVEKIEKSQTQKQLLLILLILVIPTFLLIMTCIVILICVQTKHIRASKQTFRRERATGTML